jgi:hypothetical protein
LFQFSARGRDAGFQLDDALGVGALPLDGAFKLNGRGVGAVLRLFALGFQLVAALGQRVLAGLLCANLRR